MPRSGNGFTGGNRASAGGGSIIAPAPVPVHINPFAGFDVPPRSSTPSSDTSRIGASASDAAAELSVRNPGMTAPMLPERRDNDSGAGGDVRAGSPSRNRSIHLPRSFQRRSGSSMSATLLAAGRAGSGGRMSLGQLASNSSLNSSSTSMSQSTSAHRAAMIHAMMQQAARQVAMNPPHRPEDQSMITQQQQGRSSPSSHISAGTTAQAQTQGQTHISPSTPMHRRLFHPPASATTPPSENRFRPVVGSGTVNPSVHPQFRSKAVCKLFCRHCTSVMCRRGMKAILLGNTKVELYSTDTPPTGVQLVYGDYLTQNCSCRIRDAACLGCGNVVGYHVTQPCEKCLEACNNGHFWMFLSDGVQPVDRVDASGSKLLRWAALPCAEHDRDEAETRDQYEMMCR